MPYGGRGRPPEYCPEHARANTRRLNKARPGGGHKRKSYPLCCLDAQAAKVRAYKGGRLVKTANVRVCEQHQQWRAWYRLDMTEEADKRAEANDDDLAEVIRSHRFRLTFDHPDGYFIPDPEIQVEVPVDDIGWEDIPMPSAISGYDAKVERMTRRYLAAAPLMFVPAKVPGENEPLPPLGIGDWRDRCAEGRRWHKTEAFRYSPEMNRGGGWCAKLISYYEGYKPLSTFSPGADHANRDSNGGQSSRVLLAGFPRGWPSLIAGETL